MAMAPPGIEAKNVDLPSTPEAWLKVRAPRIPTMNTETVAARIAGKFPARAATNGGVKESETAEPRITWPTWRAYGGEDMRTPSRLSAATPTIGPIIQGIGVRSRAQMYPAGMPTSSARLIAGSR